MGKKSVVAPVLGVMFLALLLTGCGIGANDDPFPVLMTNNTHQTLVDIAWFVTTPGTSNGGGQVVLKPGQSFAEEETANLGVSQDRITTLAGKTLGCLPFQFSENPPVEITVDLTEKVPCGHWGDGKQSKHDWPYRKY